MPTTQCPNRRTAETELGARRAFAAPVAGICSPARRDRELRRRVRAASILSGICSSSPSSQILVGGSFTQTLHRLAARERAYPGSAFLCFRLTMKRALGGGRPPLRFPALSGTVPRRTLGAGSACGVGGSSPAAGASVSLAPAQVKGPRYDPARYVGLTGADIIHEQLKEHGVRVVFGYPGGAILPLFGAEMGGWRACACHTRTADLATFLPPP